MKKKRYVRIMQISAVADAGFIFTLGLGSDGQVYTWHSNVGHWKLHKLEATDGE